MTYTIRFQNTGTFLAEQAARGHAARRAGPDDAHLHRQHATVHRAPDPRCAGLLRFDTHIMLPDSGTTRCSATARSPSGSPRDNLPWMVVANRVDIYFDFNPPSAPTDAVFVVIISSGAAVKLAPMPCGCGPTRRPMSCTCCCPKGSVSGEPRAIDQAGRGVDAALLGDDHGCAAGREPIVQRALRCRPPVWGARPTRGS